MKMYEKRVLRILSKHRFSTKSPFSAPFCTLQLEAFCQKVAFLRTQKHVFFLRKGLKERSNLGNYKNAATNLNF